MTKGFSFIHVSDIHLGRAFSDLSVFTEGMKLCNKACEIAFNKVIDIAIDKKVDFVLIAGDSFDGDEHDLHTKLLFRNSLKKLADNNIVSYVICGNHDPISMYKSYQTYFKFEEKYKELINITGVTTQESSHVFNFRDLAKIHSVSFETNTAPNLCSQLQEADKTCFNIGLLHCDLDKSESQYAPCSRQELRELGYDYCALGHIHVPTREDSLFVYSGSIQGRTKKETDAHGCYYVQVEKSVIKSSEFIETDCVRFIDVELDCSECQNKLDVFEKINVELNEYSNDGVKLYLAQINLTGVTSASKDLKSNDYLLEEYLQENGDYNNKIAVYEINDLTTPETELSELMEDNGVVGIIAQNFRENFALNVSDTYDEIKERHKKLYKSLGVEKDIEAELFESLEIDKESILNRVETELKSLCSEIYEN